MDASSEAIGMQPASGYSTMVAAFGNLLRRVSIACDRAWLRQRHRIRRKTIDRTRSQALSGHARLGIARLTWVRDFPPCSSQTFTTCADLHRCPDTGISQRNRPTRGIDANADR